MLTFLEVLPGNVLAQQTSLMDAGSAQRRLDDFVRTNGRRTLSDEPELSASGEQRLGIVVLGTCALDQRRKWCVQVEFALIDGRPHIVLKVGTLPADGGFAPGVAATLRPSDVEAQVKRLSDAFPRPSAMGNIGGFGASRSEDNI